MPLQALALGVLQGLTEFLPISSSGHLILAPALLGWPDQGLAFDASVHFGTALALLCYFGWDAMRSQREPGRTRPWVDRRRLGLAVVVGSVPVSLAGLGLRSLVEAHARSAQVVALSLIGWGLVLWWADRRAAGARPRALSDVGVLRALVIGAAQAIALVPGTSRSGITITTGLITGLDRPTAARFGFLLGLPVTAGAGLAEAGALLGTGLSPGEATALGLGLASSFVTGLATVWFLIRYLQRGTLAVFAIYRIALGALILWLL